MPGESSLKGGCRARSCVVAAAFFFIHIHLPGSVMPSAETTRNRQSNRDNWLAMWGEPATWRPALRSGMQPAIAITVKVQWNAKYLIERNAGAETESVEVYLSRDESDSATYKGVEDPSIGSVLTLDSEPSRPFTFHGEVIEKSPDRIKIVCERRRRVATGGRG
jgi:hypothetical protein